MAKESGFLTVLVATRQSGSALPTTLVILLILTLIGVSSMQTTLLEEKMAGNLRDQNLAFQAAEAALRAGETYLQGVTLGTFSADTSEQDLTLNAQGLYQPTLSPEHERWQQENIWTEAGSRAYAETLAGVAESPRYIIEDLSSYTKCTNAGNCTNVPLPRTPGGSLKFGPISATSRFRVTARGVGSTSAAVVLLQSYYNR
ncbi:type IV pilus assembly protein PilX [Methylocaldum marinum]|uniref:Type IV pilus assembly protein PilX n=1 Tax=Methylocaldum marinum TaxID=1432792 RepID=A0A250KUY6_9GAMM|nr:PilX N-terminal domain-containing pilus assembly protein [Methylocaldum marinum]BBA35468.1 type IV pilus assembly protein PilX [Methylocaldum marinum]